MHLEKQAQIKVQVRALIFNKTLITFLMEYFNYSNIFLVQNIAEYLKYTGK